MFPPKPEPSCAVSDKVIVAVKAEKVISKNALAWALTHVVRPGASVTLLAVFSRQKSGRRLWRFPILTAGDCRNGDRENSPDRVGQISESCSQMILQFHNQIEVRVRIKVVSGAPTGAVAYEARNNAASWVVLDNKLKQEKKHCLEELRCNIVLMKGSQPKVLRLNLECSNELQTPFFSAASSPHPEVVKSSDHRMKYSTPVSSPEETRTSYSGTTEENSLLTPGTVTSLFFVYEQNPLFDGLNRGKYTPIPRKSDLDGSLSASDMDNKGETTLLTTSKPSVASNHKSVFWIPQNHIDANSPATINRRNDQQNKSPTTKSLLDKFVQLNEDKMIQPEDQSHDRNYILNSSIREAVSLGRTSSMPPPLCSLCQHKAPTFGKPPRRFAYEELEEATDRFADINFLAEGSFGLVHRGVLRDGQVIAVKQLKFSGCQGDNDFCREVRVLSCAQHRNVVMLIGFCIESTRRVLVYEYICNGSLDFHLHGNKRTPLDWQSRLKIAVGAARGLRYLHEDCRVGCIIHRDMRPKNILLTHDYEPLVGDFGLARLHAEWDTCDEERVVGTSGYLAPEYFHGGEIAEKVDIYAFGLVLMELITSQKTSEVQNYEGRQFVLAEKNSAFTALEPRSLLADKLLNLHASSGQLHNLSHGLQALVQAASLCLQQDPDCRPPMSKVLRILERGDAVIPLGLDLNSVGSRSGHMRGLNSRTQVESRKAHSRRLSH